MDHFRCDLCGTVQDMDLLCLATASAVSLPCVHCCACETHDSQDVPGTVIFGGTPFTWRGLHACPVLRHGESEQRMRRHT